MILRFRFSYNVSFNIIGKHKFGPYISVLTLKNTTHAYHDYLVVIDCNPVMSMMNYTLDGHNWLQDEETYVQRFS